MQNVSLGANIPAMISREKKNRVRKGVKYFLDR